MVAQTAEFKKAVEDSRKLKAKPSDDELLQVRQQWLQASEIEMDT
jgi:diazepam-binding inhibitor (GABA receptor modulating acyl-CoA-binding protein)